MVIRLLQILVVVRFDNPKRISVVSKNTIPMIPLVYAPLGRRSLLKSTTHRMIPTNEKKAIRVSSFSAFGKFVLVNNKTPLTPQRQHN